MPPHHRAPCSGRHHVPYIFESEGAHLSLIYEASSERCKALCEVTAACNAVRWRQKTRWLVECHLKSQCVTPGRERPTKAPPLHNNPFQTEYKFPCTTEVVAFPQPGIRRSLPPDEPTGACPGPTARLAARAELSRARVRGAQAC